MRSALCPMLLKEGGDERPYGCIDETDEIWWEEEPFLQDRDFRSSFFQGWKVYRADRDLRSQERSRGGSIQGREGDSVAEEGSSAHPDRPPAFNPIWDFEKAGRRENWIDCLFPNLCFLDFCRGRCRKWRWGYEHEGINRVHCQGIGRSS